MDANAYFFNISKSIRKIQFEVDAIVSQPLGKERGRSKIVAEGKAIGHLYHRCVFL